MLKLMQNALISHASKVMLKILQGGLQQYMNHELPDVQAGFRKGRGTRDQIANIHWIMEKSKRVPEKHLLLLHWRCQSLWLCGSQQIVENSSRDGNTRPPYLPPKKSVCRSRSNRTEDETMDWFQIGKGVRQGCILSPCLFNLYAEYIMWNASWITHKLKSRLPGETSITSNIQMIPLLWQKVRGTKEPLDDGERGEWKSCLKTQHSKNKDHGILVQPLHSKEMGKQWKQWQSLCSWAPKWLWMLTAAMKLKNTWSLEEKQWQT